MSRSERIRNGTSLDQIEALWRFDRALRLICLDGFESIEIGLRTQLAHVLGRRNPFGHLDSDSLDTEVCSRESNSPGGRTNFDVWLAQYHKLQQDARNEDYVVHHTTKYGERVPVWIAVEFLDFGAVTRLFSFMLKTDQNEVARQFGVHGGRQFARWLRDFNYLRNVCAHHSRLWNRTLTYKSGKFNPKQVDAVLAHAAACEGRDKIYVNLASMAYCIRMIAPQAVWHLELRRHIENFPAIEGMSPSRDMGFPPAWKSLALWNIQP